jgi:hypothetical protein
MRYDRAAREHFGEFALTNFSASRVVVTDVVTLPNGQVQLGLKIEERAAA